MNQYKCLLFDFGGVLIDWDGVTPLLTLTQGRLTSEQARRFWLESPWVRTFEAGACTAEAFAQGVVSELQLAMTPQQLLTQFASWDKGPLPGARALLETLQPRFTLACLSNNNPVHWNSPHLQQLLPLFHSCFVSFETGFVKPDRTTFLHVLNRLPFQPAEILFFDDNPECVQAARAVGFVAHQVRGLQAVRQALQECGITV